MTTSRFPDVALSVAEIFVPAATLLLFTELVKAMEALASRGNVKPAAMKIAAATKIIRVPTRDGFGFLVCFCSNTGRIRRGVSELRKDRSVRSDNGEMLTTTWKPREYSVHNYNHYNSTVHGMVAAQRKPAR